MLVAPMVVEAVLFRSSESLLLSVCLALASPNAGMPMALIFNMIFILRGLVVSCCRTSVVEV